MRLDTTVFGALTSRGGRGSGGGGALPGCSSGGAAALGVSLAAVVLGGTFVWMGWRLVQEPNMPAAVGSPEDGARAQQKSLDVARGGATRARSAPHAVILSEAELNGFLSRNLV